MDIIVTTPKSEMANAAKEAEMAKKHPDSLYFRRFNTHPCNIKPGERVWYVENGFIRGYAVVDQIENIVGNARVCAATGRFWHPGVYVLMRADSWKWVKPLPMKGFQGYRQAKGLDHTKTIGGWKDPKPQ
jgi:hypothetical protein